MDSDDSWKALNATSRLHTVTFRYPKTFLIALAKSEGRTTGYASTMAAETFIREAVAANIEDLIQTHLSPPKKKMTARISKNTSTASTKMMARLRRT